jgi:adenosylcobinamide kinase/adenosylcobinamide-phosphate guanylyltransferase
MKTLVLGGAKSGKSLFAENLAIQSQKKLTYIATAQPYDGEMAQRISSHQQRRLEQAVHWETIEEPIALARTLKQLTSTIDIKNKQLVLIDCLTLWLSNLLLNLNKKLQQIEINAVFDVLVDYPSDVIFVSNETGLGIVPANQLSRQFIDIAGELHQRMATRSDRVILTVAGLPLILKGTL